MANQEVPTAPRIMPAQLIQNISRCVRIAGEVQQSRGDMVSLLTPHGNVNVTGVSRIQDGFKYVEVEGIVNDDGSMQEMAVSNLGDDFDLETYYQAVNLTDRFPELFNQ